MFSSIVLFAIVVLSLIPVPEVAPLKDVPLIDKWTHMAMYGGLSGAMWIDALRRHEKTRQWLLAILTIVLPTLIGGALELIQPFVNRNCDLMDFIADGAGAVLGCVTGLVLARMYKG